MLNQVVVVGRLVRDPENIETENGSKGAKITLAVSRSYKNVDGIYETDFLDARLFASVANSTVEYCKKGDLVGIKGRIQSKTIETEEGKKYEMEIIAERVTFLCNCQRKEEENGD